MAVVVWKFVGQRVLVSVVIAAALLVWLGVRLVPETSPVARGRADAFSGGCIICHGQPDEVASDDLMPDCSEEISEPSHPSFEADCHDLLAYFEVIRLKRTFDRRASSSRLNRLLEGERLARQYNCFQCHGELGQGGFANRRALKGYVPGYFGRDFAALTRGGDIASVRSWISHGVDHVLYENPLTGPFAKYFIERQEVGMPKFATLPESEIQILAEYVIALNRIGVMDASAIRAYEQLTLQNRPSTERRRERLTQSR